MYIEIRDLDDPTEIKKLEYIQREAWGEGNTVVPAHVMIAAHEVGGVLLGAYYKDRLVGYVFGFPGRFKGKPCLYSHQLAVIPEYQNKGIGTILKLKQREKALELGYDLIIWTYDPLRSKNALLNITKLGTVTDTYLVNHYGEMNDNLNRGVDSDRFMVEWWIESRWYFTRKRYRFFEDIDFEVNILLNAQIEQGDIKPLKNSLEWTDFIGVEIPSDIDRVGSNIIELKRLWREATRQVFLQAFERNYMVIYYLLYRENPYKGVYILQRNFRDFE